MDKLTCPYLGLKPFSGEDSRFFFGRERETRLVINNLYSERLTLLYGASGVGKSSLLRAGVMPALTRSSAGGGGERPEQVVVYFDNWQGDVLGDLLESVRRSVAKALHGAVIPSVKESAYVADWLQTIAARNRIKIFFLLDQFEEYFVYHGSRGGQVQEPFALQFAEAVSRPGLPASFLVALRDDAFSRLDRFKALIPDLFSNYLRLKPLSTQAAREAITKPLKEYDALAPAEQMYGSVEIETDLVDKIIEELSRGRLPVEDMGEGPSAEEEEGVEAPYIQLVMTRIWRHEMETGSRTLWARTLDDLGGTETIVRRHLDEVMASLSAEERKICSRMFRYLVTPSDMKVACTAKELGRYASVATEHLDELLVRLAAPDLRVLAPVASPTGMRYEIYHDYLGPAILRWRRRFRKDQAQKEFAAELDRQLKEAEQQRRRARRKTLALSAVAVLAVVAMAFAWLQAARAGKSDRATRAENSVILLKDKEIVAKNQEIIDLANEIKPLRGEAANGSDLQDRLDILLRRISEIDSFLTAEIDVEKLKNRHASQLGRELLAALAEKDRLEDQLAQAKIERWQIPSDGGEAGQQRTRFEAVLKRAHDESRNLEAQLLAADAKVDLYEQQLETLRDLLGAGDTAGVPAIESLAEELLQRHEALSLQLDQIKIENEYLVSELARSDSGEAPEPVESRNADIEEARLDVGAYPEGPLRELARQRLQVLEGEELIARAVEALGGERAVDSIRMIDMRGFVQSRFLPVQARARGRLLIEFSDLLFLEQEDTKTVFAVRGGDEYSGVNDVIEKAPLEEHSELLAALAEDPRAVLQMRLREDFSVVTSESESGQSMVGITIGSQPYVLGIEDSGRITSISFTGKFFDNVGEFHMDYSDHREVDGMEMPFYTVVYFDAEEVARIELTSVELNELLDARPYELFDGER